MKKLVSIIALVLCSIVIMAACEGEDEQNSQSSGQQASYSKSQQSPGASQSSSAAIQPRQLISKDDAVKLVGEPLKDGRESESIYQGISSCFYAPEKSDSKSYLLIALLQKASSGSQQSGGSSGSQQSSGPSGQSGGLSPKSVFDILKKIFTDPNIAVSGFIGDDKFIMSHGMCILAGESCVYIAVGNADPIKAQEIQKQAAELAVINLNRIQGK